MSSPASDTAPQREQFPKLYASYFFAAWGDRMWEFAAILFLIALFPTSLMPSSLFGFCETMAGIAMGTTIGQFVDSTDRLRVIRVSILGQNVVIIFAALVFVFELQHKQAERDAAQIHSPSSSRKTEYASFLVGATTRDLITLVIIVLCGMVAKVTSSLNKISIHKDWAVVLAAGDSTAQTQINSNMRRVDLSCAILAPMSVGILSSAFSPAATCMFIACWSLGSIFVEMQLSKTVYDALPALQIPKKKQRELQQQQQKESAAAAPPAAVVSSAATAQKKHNKGGDGESDSDDEASSSSSFFALFDKYYLRHPVFPISLPYCLLYISVLSFASTMVAFLRTRGCSDWLLAAGRAAAALVAIFSTFCVEPLVQRFGLFRAGRLTIWMQITALTPIAYVFLTSSSPSSSSSSSTADDTSSSGFGSLSDQTSFAFLATLFVSLCLSRFGLWSFDIVQTQMMQESILLSQAGRVNGGQEIVINACYVVSYTLTMVVDDPDRFHVPALVSYGSVLLAGVLFALFAEESFGVCTARKAAAEARGKRREEREKQVEQTMQPSAAAAEGAQE